MTFMCTEAPNSSAPMCTGSNMDSTGTTGAMPPGAIWPVTVVFSFNARRWARGRAAGKDAGRPRRRWGE